MTLFKVDLDFDAVNICSLAINAFSLKGFKSYDGNNIKLVMAFSDDNKKAFIVYGYKDQKCIRLLVELNENKINISTGQHKNNIVTNILTKTFDPLNKKELFEASKYFESLIND